MIKKGEFKSQKFLDVGTMNPIVSRLTIGLHDIIEMAQIDQSSKDSINDANFVVMQNIIKAEKIGNSICQMIETVTKKINKEGIKTQSSGRCVDLPFTEGLDEIRIFLKYSKNALQELVKVFNVFLKTNLSNPRYDKLQAELFNKYGTDYHLSKLIKEDHDLWIKKVLDLRDEDEHPSVQRLYFDFDINWDTTAQKWVVLLPRFYDDTQIYDLIRTTIHNLLTFTEEVNILFLQKVMPETVIIYEIPEAERKKDCEIRFQLGLKGTINLEALNNILEVGND
ncbi:MAG: hypothetical protein H8D45_08140 [Bacteroidetes bacterium]|nr:hypothetical protein [Bacteroidota bacterium]MBL7197285.1 hypothetical protein [Candidatus Omnitrophota bacterium]